MGWSGMDAKTLSPADVWSIVLPHVVARHPLVSAGEYGSDVAGEGGDGGGGGVPRRSGPEAGAGLCLRPALRRRRSEADATGTDLRLGETAQC